MRLRRLLRRSRGRHAAARGGAGRGSRKPVLELPDDFVVQPAAVLPRQRPESAAEPAEAPGRPARRGPTIAPG